MNITWISAFQIVQTFLKHKYNAEHRLFGSVSYFILFLLNRNWDPVELLGGGIYVPAKT